jgi:hypothetical protein
MKNLRKRLLLLLSLIILNLHSYSSYRATLLWELIEKSEIIVLGEIVEVNDSNFKVIILERLKSASLVDTLTILKFQEWTCASRYANYSVGQRGVYFLNYRKNCYETMGEANEGEKVVLGNYVYIREYNPSTIFETVNMKSISANQDFVRLHYKTVRRGIKDYMKNKEEIHKEFETYFGNNVSPSNSYTDNPKRNDFIRLVLDQLDKLISRNLR